MYINRIIQLVTFVIGMTVFSFTAQADDDFAFGGLSPTCFSYPAVAMTPNQVAVPSLKQDELRVSFDTTSLRFIQLYGQVQKPYPPYEGDTTFSVSFVDPDGKRRESSVSAQLLFVGNDGTEVISELHSDSHATVTDDVQNMSKVIDESKLQKTDGYYIVSMFIRRTKIGRDAGLDPAALGYNLCSAAFKKHE